MGPCVGPGDSAGDSEVGVSWRETVFNVIFGSETDSACGGLGDCSCRVCSGPAGKRNLSHVPAARPQQNVPASPQR